MSCEVKYIKENYSQHPDYQRLTDTYHAGMKTLVNSQLFEEKNDKLKWAKEGTSSRIKQNKLAQSVEDEFNVLVQDNKGNVVVNISPLIVQNNNSVNNYNGITVELGRSKIVERGKVQNIIVKYNGKPITGENKESGLGEMNVMIQSKDAFVGMIRIPTEFIGKGLSKYIYQATADLIGIPIINSKDRGESQTEDGGRVWKNKTSFQPNQNIQSSEIKPGVEEVFNSSPELATIGSKEEYSYYLDSIFPDSEVKDIKQHSTEANFKSFTKEGSGRLGKGFYFSDFGNNYIEGENVKNKFVLLNIKNPLNIQGGQFMKDVYKLLDDRNQSSDDVDAKIQAQKDINNEYKQKADALIGDKNGVLNSEIKVFEPEQIHILGSKQDIEGFKKFVNNQTQFQNVEGKSNKIKVSNLVDDFSNKLETFLLQFGFSIEQLDDLKETTGYNILGATDFLEKVIFVQKDNINQVYSKEAAYSIFNLLGRKNLLRKDLIASIHLIDGYDNLKSKYINNKLNDYQIRELIAIDYLQSKLIEAHKETLITDNKVVSKDVTAKNTLEYTILKIKKWWADILRKWFASYKRGVVENAFNQIANDVINNNTRLFNLQSQKNYSKLEIIGKQKEINNQLTKLGAINSGSYALNKQGTLTREKLNDLDYYLPFNIKDDFIKKLQKIYPQTIFTTPYSGVMGNRSLTLSVKIDDVKIDFFLPTSQEESDKNKIIVIDNVKYHYWKNIFDAKIRIGSQKHLSDLAEFTPFQKEFTFINNYSNFNFFENQINEKEILLNAIEDDLKKLSPYSDEWYNRLSLAERELNSYLGVAQNELIKSKEQLNNFYKIEISKSLDIIGQRHYNFDFIQSKFNSKQYSSSEEVYQSNNVKTYWDKNLEQTAFNYFKENNIDFEKSLQYQNLLSYFNNNTNKAITAYYLTFSENFKKFYGNIDSRKNLPSFVIKSINGKYSKPSILLDEYGEPVIFYHGAGTRFDKFSKDYFLSGEGAMAYGAGFYSTNYKPTADNYRDTSAAAYKLFQKLLEEENKELLELISNFKNDITETSIIQFLQGSIGIEDKNNTTKLLSLLGLTETKALYVALTNPIYWQKEISTFNKQLIEKEFKTKLKSTKGGEVYRELEKTLKITDKELSSRLYQIGIDGVINITHGGQTAGGFSHIKGEKHVIFFEPIQSKSVTNSGLFSLNNENMYDPMYVPEDIVTNEEENELGLAPLEIKKCK